MSEIQFVDINGKPWSPKQTPKKPKSAKGKGKNFSRGIIVEGYRPDDIEAARRIHDEERDRAIKEGQADKGEFNEYAWMSRNKPTRWIRLFTVPAAAADCVALLQKSGWKRVSTRDAK